MINFKLQTTTGIYVGPKAVYIAQLKGTVFGFRLVKFGKTEISAPAQTAETSQQRMQAVVQAVKRIIRENNITTKRVFTALAGKDVLIRHFKMPRIPKPEWETAIKFEARKYIPFKIEELMWDFHVFLPKLKKAKMEITFVAVKKEVAQRYLSLFKEAELNVLMLEPAPFSLLRLFTLSNQLVKGKPTAIVDVNYGLADINIVKDKTSYLTRDVSIPLEKEVIFDNLLNEIKMSLDYYEKQFPTEEVAKILLCGDVQLKDWDQKLSEELKLPVEKIDFNKVMRLGKVLPPLTMSVAIGLALRGLAKGVAEVNLARVSKVKPEVVLIKENWEFTPEVRRAAFRAALLSLAGLLILHLSMLAPLNREKEKLKQLISSRPEIDLPISSFSYAKIEQVKKELERNLATLDLVIDERVFWTNKFNELPKAIPLGVWLTDLYLAEDLSKDNKVSRSLIVKGIAYHENPVQQIALVTKFVSNLQENKLFPRGFKEIKMAGIQSADLKGASVKKFTISCKQ